MKRIGMVLALCLLLAGCQQVRELAMAEKEMSTFSWRSAGYDKIYLLVTADREGQESPGCLVFDFSGDQYALVPGGEEQWQEVVGEDELNALLAEYSGEQPRQLSLRPCLSCPPQVVGLVLGSTPLVYDYLARDQTLTFQKAMVIYQKQE